MNTLNKKTKINRFVYGKDQFSVFEDLQKTEDKQYIQVIGLNDLEKMNQIAEMFSIEMFIMEDILNVNQRNKIERVGDYIFSSFSLMYNDQGTIGKDYMSLILKDNVVITFHEKRASISFTSSHTFRRIPRAEKQ